MTARRARAAAAALLAAGLLITASACGGGGDTAASGDAPPSAAASLPPAATVVPGDGGAAAVAGLGALRPVEADSVAGELPGFETLGGPHDPFRQQDRGQPAPAEDAPELTATPAEASAAAAPAVPAATPVPLGGAAVTAPAVPAAPVAPAAAPVSPPPAEAAPAGGATVGPAKRREPAEALVADLDVSGDAVSGGEGDRIPPGTGWLTLEAVGAEGVVLRLEGGLLPGGEDTVTLGVGRSVTLRTAAGATRRVTLVRVRSA